VLSTGCRRGELAALRWEDVDLERGELTVARSLETTKGTLTFREPKTKRSRRKVTLPAFAVEALLRHKAAQAEERLSLGAAYEYP
jgi:integrase